MLNGQPRKLPPAGGDGRQPTRDLSVSPYYIATLLLVSTGLGSPGSASLWQVEHGRE